MDINAMLGGQGMMPNMKEPLTFDTAETIYISSLALLKMLKHGKEKKGKK